MQEVEVSAQLFLSATLFILLFSSTASHFLIISCAAVWSIHGLLYTSPCSGEGPFMGTSPSGVITTPVPAQAAFSVALCLPYSGLIPVPSPSELSVIQYGFPLTVPPLPKHNSSQECISSISPSMSPYTFLFHFISAGRPLYISPHMSCSCIFLRLLSHLLLLPPLCGMYILHQCLPPFLVHIQVRVLCTSLTG